MYHEFCHKCRGHHLCWRRDVRGIRIPLWLLHQHYLVQTQLWLSTPSGEWRRFTIVQDFEFDVIFPCIRVWWALKPADLAFATCLDGNGCWNSILGTTGCVQTSCLQCIIEGPRAEVLFNSGFFTIRAGFRKSGCPNRRDDIFCACKHLWCT